MSFITQKVRKRFRNPRDLAWGIEIPPSGIQKIKINGYWH